MNFLIKNQNLKKKNIFFCACVECVEGGRGVRGDGGGGGGYVRKPICSFNFFEVGGIIMHKCKSHVPDKLNL